MDKWDPREEDFSDPKFNSYDTGLVGEMFSQEHVNPAFTRPDQKKEIKLYVRGIPNNLTQEALKNVFSAAGDVLEVKKCESKKLDRNDTFGFVTFGRVKDAEAAISQLDGYKIGQFTLRVSVAQSPEEKKRREQKKLEEQQFLDSLNASGKLQNTEDEFGNIEPPPDGKHITASGRSGLKVSVRSDTIADVEPQLPSPGLKGDRGPVKGLGRAKMMQLAAAGTKNSPENVPKPAVPKIRTMSQRYGAASPPRPSKSDSSEQNSPQRPNPSPSGPTKPSPQPVVTASPTAVLKQTPTQRPSPGSVNPTQPSPKQSSPHVTSPNPSLHTPSPQAVLESGPPTLSDHPDAPPELKSGYDSDTSNQSSASKSYGRGGRGRGRRGNNYNVRGGPPRFNVPYSQQQYAYPPAPLHALCQCADCVQPHMQQSYYPPVQGYMPQSGYQPQGGYYPHGGYNYQHNFQYNPRGGRRGGPRYQGPQRGGHIQQSENPMGSSPTPGNEGPGMKKTPKPVRPPRPCNVCKTMTSKYCTSCQYIHYCSRECQTKDWADHKVKCSHFKGLGDLESKFDITIGENLINPPAGAVNPNTGAANPPATAANPPTGAANPTAAANPYTGAPNPPVDAVNKSQTVDASHDKEEKALSPSPVGDVPARSVSPGAPRVKSFRIQHEKIPETSKVVIQEFYSPKNIWVNIATKQIENNLHELGASMQKAYQNSENKAPNSYTPEKGELIAAKFKDGAWYRAQVECINQNMTLTVLFVDYGNKDDVHIKDTRKINEGFINLKKQGIQCALYGVESETSWPSNLAGVVKTFLGTNSQLVCKYRGQRNSERQVDLMHPQTGKSLAEHLAEKGLCRLQGVSNRNRSQSGGSTGSDNSPREPSPRDNKSSFHPTETRQAPQGANQSAQGASKSPQGARPKESQSQQDTHQKERQVAQGARPKSPRYKSKIKELQLNKQLMTVVTEVVSPSEFYIQLADDGNEIAELAGLLETLHATCESEKLNPDFRVTVGDEVAVKYSQDGRWNRGLVVAIRDKEAKVKFVDYGNKEKLLMADLLPLKDEFTLLPTMAICCSLVDIKPAAGKWPSNAVSWFKSQVMGADASKLLIATVCKVDEKFAHITLNKDGTDINAALIARGYDKINDTSGKPLAPPSVSDKQVESTTSPSKQSQPISIHIIPRDSLPKDGTPALITDVTNPSDFHVAFIETDHKNYNAECAAGCTSPLMQPKVGALMAYLHADFGEWYRAEIKEIQGDMLQVYSYDWGFMDSVKASDAKMMPDALSAKPAVATNCALVGVVGSGPGGSWPPEANALIEGKTATVSVIQANPGGKVLVDLIIDGKSVVDQLIETGMAVKGNIQPVQVTASAPIAPPSPQAVEPATVQSPTSAEVQQPTVPQASQQPQATPSVIHKPSFKPAQVPSEPNTVGMLLSANSPHDLYILSNSLLDFVSGLNEQIQAAKPSLCTPKPGQLVAYYSDGFKEFYRAEVTGVTGDVIHVFAIDWGFDDQTSAKFIYELPADLKAHPASALHCKLANITRTDPKGWNDESTRILNGLLNTQVTFSVIDSATVPVTISMTSIENGKDVGELIVQAGGAVMCVDPGELPEGDTLVDIGVLMREELYVKPQADTPTAARISQQLGQFYPGGSQPIGSSAKPGEIVAVKWAEDGQWYRGEISATSPQSSTVYFMDYGNCAEAVNSDIYKLDLQFFQPRQLAIRCGIADLDNPTSLLRDYDNSVLLRQLEENASVVGVLLLGSGPGGISMVELLNPTNGQSITQAVMKKTTSASGVSARSETAPPPAPVPQASPVPAPQSSVAPSSHPQATPSSQSQGIFEEAMKKDHLVDNCSVVVSHVNRDNFYCQVFSGEESLAKMNVLEQLLGRLYETAHSPDFMPAIGEMCAAKLVDDLPSRAVVCKHVSAVELEVHDLDYGTEAKVSIEDIRPFTPSLAQLSLMAIHCKLDLPDGFDYTAANATMISLLPVLGEQFTVKILNTRGTCHIVDLIDSSGASVSRELSNKFPVRVAQAAAPVAQPAAPVAVEEDQGALIARLMRELEEEKERRRLAEQQLQGK